MNWSYDSREQAWYTSLNGCQAHVTVSPHWHVYLAAVKPQQGPQRIAPRAFNTFKEAQQWCRHQAQAATSS